MILLHHLADGEAFYVSSRIKMIEPGADTVIHLMSGDVFRVQESAEEVIDKVWAWEQSIHSTLQVVRKVEEIERVLPDEEPSKA